MHSCRAVTRVRKRCDSRMVDASRTPSHNEGVRGEQPRALNQPSILYYKTRLGIFTEYETSECVVHG
jgi:hypothetical protein